MQGLSGLVVVLAAALWLAPAAAQDREIRQSPLLLVDAASGAVLQEEHATQPWYPASLTKVMTAYVVFQAIAAGRLGLDEEVAVSAHAAAQPPTKLGVTAGRKLRIRVLLEAMIVRSANDAAVALAEAVSGSEDRFAISMTRQARALGMTQSAFRNASGLPDPGQVTTARDLIILARALITEFPERFALFSQKQFTYDKLTRPTTMSWLRGYAGAEGFKTGFTCGSGYNLLSAATRNGRRLIAVVLGARSSSERNARMTKLMDDGFATAPGTVAGTVLLSALGGQPAAAVPYVLADGRCPVAASPVTAALPEGKLPGWGLVFGSFVDREKAHATIRGNQAALKAIISKGRPAIVAKRKQVPPSYSALLVGLQEKDASQACQHLRSLGIYCLAVPPKLLNNPQALWQ